MANSTDIALRLFLHEDDEPDAVYLVHRGDFDHVDDPGCCCGPLLLTEEQLRAYRLPELTNLIQSFLRYQ